jgi:hypothetical protein
MQMKNLEYVYLALKELSSSSEFSLSPNNKILVAQYAEEELDAAKYRMRLTTKVVGGLCGLVGFIAGWLVFSC